MSSITDRLKKIFSLEYMRREVTVTTIVFMSVNLILGLISAVSMIINNTSLSAEDMAMTPETFASYGFGNVTLGEIVYLCIYLAMFAVPVAIAVIIYNKQQMNEYISFKRPKFWLTVGGIFGVYAINYACYIITAAGSLVFSSVGIAFAADRFTPLQAVIFCVIVAVAPAILEEFTFRGFILGRIGQYNRTAAVILSALLFAFMHMTVEQIPFAFFAGLLLGYIYLRTKSIWSVIIIHFFNNLFAFAETVALQYCADEEYTSAVFTAVFAGLFLIGFVSLLIIVFTHKGSDVQGQVPSGRAICHTVLHPAVIVSVVLCAFVALTYAGVFTR